MCEWQRKVTNELVNQKQHLKTEISIMKSKMNNLEKDNKKLIEEAEKMKKKLKNGKKKQETEMKMGVGLMVCFVLSVIGSVVVVKLMY